MCSPKRASSGLAQYTSSSVIDAASRARFQPPPCRDRGRRARTPSAGPGFGAPPPGWCSRWSRCAGPSWPPGAAYSSLLYQAWTQAEETGASAAQVSTAWLRERGTRSAATLVPIVGPRTLTRLDDYLGALEVTLTDEQHIWLGETSTVEFTSCEVAERNIKARPERGG
ncbi:aldo/keto reductase [Streptomyces sp. NPDC047070]|uniref:aldo/keto reductase n=1 Tax=Streptomyces sp. NPDC047070 TaxID=3154923 RepID=UPI003456FB3A